VPARKRPRLHFRFRQAAYDKLRSTLLGKTILFTDHGEDWSDEQIVLAYRAQHPVEADFRRLKNPHYLSFRPPSTGPTRSWACTPSTASSP
jgi:transposase